jgi:rhodanese-related sulfurtransferase
MKPPGAEGSPETLDFTMDLVACLGGSRPRNGEIVDWYVAARRTTINDLLEAARQRLDRVEPRNAVAALRDGALLVDIRSEHDRERDGVIPGTLFFPRNVLEWRVDPASEHSAPELGDAFHCHIILVCNEGYQSSLAAATLQELGFARATDLIGGFQAWRAAGLPVESAAQTTVLE